MSQDIVRCELQTWRTTTGADGVQNKTLIDNAADKKREQEEEIYALVLNREYEVVANKETACLTVNSPHILKALRATVKLHPSVSGDFTAPTEIKGPFQILVYYWDEIHAYVEIVEDDEARMHLNLLLDFMASELGQNKKQAHHLQTLGSCEFDSLWTIFKPGCIAYTEEKEQPRLLEVIKTAYGKNSNGAFLEVQCSFTDHNGRAVGRGKHDYTLYKATYFSQSDPAKITDLLIYPRLYNDKGSELETYLAERGKRFLELSQESTVKNYDGPAMCRTEPPPMYYDPNQGQDPGSWTAFTETGRIVLDRKGYGQEHVPPILKPKPELDDNALTLCPAFMYGYSCARKEWCRFFLRFIHEATWRPNPFDQMVLPGNQKELVKALVSSHNFPENSRDQTLQKGKGLVVLLHGTPGSGKTLTAECAAEHTRRALFSCTMSELNEYNYASYFERRLARVLRLATSWKAIVLLDEADVFLEARQDGNSNTDRNALVAVFLKHLEYFSGIIFLTTNRIQTFDQAMRSRIHLALAFKPPGRVARRNIWRYELNKLSDAVFDADIEGLLDKVQDEDVNGREISNALLTAATLARYNKQKLGLEHIETVMSVRREFSMELKRLARSATDDHKGYRIGSIPVRQGSILDGITDEPEQMSD